MATTQQLRDTMRQANRQLRVAVEHARIALRKGTRVDEFVGEYIRLVRSCSELQARGRAIGLDGPLFQDMEPIPFRTGFVGISEAEKFARGWDMAAFNFKTIEATPAPLLMAAE